MKNSHSKHTKLSAKQKSAKKTNVFKIAFDKVTTTLTKIWNSIKHIGNIVAIEIAIGAINVALFFEKIWNKLWKK